MRPAATGRRSCSCAGRARATARSVISRRTTSPGASGGGGGGGGRATIGGVRRRRSVLARRAAGERSPRRQPIAANVDQVLVVAAARDPEPNPRMLDRFLVIAEANRLPCVVILNKIELDRSALERLARRYGVAGYQVLATSVKQRSEEHTSELQSP